MLGGILDLERTKMIVMGPAKSGKGKLIERLENDRFPEDSEDTSSLKISLAKVFGLHEECDLKLNYIQESKWQYLKDKHIFFEATLAVIVYDITSRESFLGAVSLFFKSKKETVRNCQYLLLGNKTDLEGQRKVTTDEAEGFARNHDMFFMESSMKTTSNEALVSKLKEMDQKYHEISKQYPEGCQLLNPPYKDEPAPSKLI